MKIKTITFERRRSGLVRGSYSYRVQKVTDTVAYSPGDELDQTQVEDLCEQDAWRVTIVKGGK